MFGFRDVDILRAIARHGGFRAASDATGVAQSAISRRVRYLEDRMKVTIFEREGRGVRLTAVGRRLVEEAEILLSHRDRILQELTQGLMAGVVRLGVAETMTHTVLPALLTELRTRHPNLRFEVSVDTSEQMGRMLVADELDVAIMMRDLAPPGFELTPLAPVSLGWFHAPEHFTLPTPARLVDLATLPIVTFPKTTLPHRRVVGLLTPVRREAIAIHGSASLATMLHLVSRGFGIGTIPHDIVAGWPHVGLAEIEVSSEARLPDLDFAVCYTSERNETIGREVTRAALDAQRI